MYSDEKKIWGLSMKKINVSIASLVLVVVMVFQVTWAEPSLWAKRSVVQLEILGILSGALAEDSLMKQPINRETFAELAVKLYLFSTGLAFESLSKVHDFKDTTNPYVGAAFRLGIIKGFSETQFSPKAPVTREQIAAMLHREVVLLGLATTHKAGTPFADASKISAYARQSIAFAQYHQLIQGVSGNRFDPQGKATREQVYKIAEGIVTKFGLGISTYPAFTSTLGVYKVPKSQSTQLVLSEAQDRGISLRIQSGPVQSGVAIQGTTTTNRPNMEIERQWMEIFDILSPQWGYQTSRKVVLDLKEQWLGGEMRYAGPRVIYITKDGVATSDKPVGASIQLAYNGAVTVTVYK